MRASTLLWMRWASAMTDAGSLILREAQVLACAQELDEVQRLCRQLQEHLKRYYEEELAVHPEKAGLLTEALRTAEWEIGLTGKKKAFLEDLVTDFRGLRSALSSAMDPHEAALEGLIGE